VDENQFVPPAEIVDDRSPSNDARPLARSSRQAICAMRFDLSWRSAQARHTDSQVSQKLNLWRDIFPPELEAGVLDRPVGHRTSRDYPAGGLIEPYRDVGCFDLKPHQFNNRYRKGGYVEPRTGRFYPRGFIAGVRGIFPEDATPFRVTGEGERLGVELNHPLADRELNLAVTILDIRQAGQEHGGFCHDIAELVTLAGPGMQARWRDQPTDFWSDLPFARMSGEPDAYFYAMPRMVDHLDSRTLGEIEALYARLIPPGGEVLDLMASWKSHLPESLALSRVAGLGMNRAELEANPRLDERLVHDLNLQPTLPYEENRFDAIVCTVSVEYLIKPLELFVEAMRVLKPGGRLIVTFSNRWFQPKVVKIWQDLHEFERMGLVLEYFLHTGGFTRLETWSLRGQLRPADDKYAGQLPFADPLYAVWGEKV
jgi:SAM-dependent methyltransferase